MMRVRRAVGRSQELIAGDALAIWAWRAAGAALILFGLAVLISSLVGGS